MSNHIQNDIVDAISSVMLDEIKREISEVSFISIMLDEKNNFSTLHSYPLCCDTSLMMVPSERFMGFSDVSDDWTAVALTEHVFTFVEKYC